MPQRLLVILTVGLAPEVQAGVAQAAQTVRPHATAIASLSVEDATRRVGPPGNELLVLGAGVSEMQRQQAANVLSADGLPRWPVVVLEAGPPAERIWHAPPDSQDAADLARLFEVALAQHGAIREARRARGDLWTIARRISHEMRSPLGCILTSADVLKEELSADPATEEALVQPIVDSANDLMALLDRVTLVARATAAPTSPGPVDMGMVVWSARERFAMKIAASGATVVEPDEWPAVVGVGDWLDRVWQNLIGNALEHAGPKPHVELGWTRDDGELRFFVRDDGAGVQEDVQPLLFRPFHQLHQNDSGRGLGLSLVQRLIELQGGRCGFEPVQPHGACFFFTLPAGEAPAGA